MEYRELKTKYFEQLANKQGFIGPHPECECRGCHKKAVDIHHKAKRGKHLLDTSTWMAVCRQCHDKIEEHKTWARKEGYLNE